MRKHVFKAVMKKWVDTMTASYTSLFIEYRKT